MKKKIILIGGILPTLIASQSAFALESKLSDAHRAYAESNFSEMVSAVKSVLMDEQYSQFERSNALKLWSEAHKQNNHLPSDWRLPNSIKKLKVSVQRRDSEGSIRYDFKVKGDTSKGDLIEQLQVIKYPNLVIIDKKAKVYEEWEDEIWDGTPEFKVQSLKQRERFEQGLYLLNIDTKDGEKVRGWFVITDENSSATPEILSPKPNGSVFGPHPTIHFEDFTSPEYRGFEYRGLWVGVTKILNGGWEYLWGHYEGDPKRTSIQLGEASVHSGDQVELEKGRYWLTVTFMETKSFGDLRIQRESRSSQSINVE